ncbi:MAG: AAA family ATPase [Treponema sp.]|nr:AAA family ATPase [Treponema sp.]
MKIITVTNQKGGAGKTTTVDAVLSALTLKGIKALAVDLDPQCNLTFSMNADSGKDNILDVLTGESKVQDAIQHLKNGDLIAGTAHLAAAESILTQTGKEYRLKESLEEIKNQYDYILIDTPPALGILTINALTACTSVVIPAQADIYSIQGIQRLAETIKPVKQYTNPQIKIDGILLTRYNDRTVLSRTVAELAEQIAQGLNARLFKATIREATAIKEAQISQKSIFEYAKGSKVAEDYSAFVEELLSFEK